MDELMDQFAIEARELVQQAGDDLLVLEKSPGDRARLESAFRAIHTLKGSVGLFDFGPMPGVLHQAENLLDAARGRAIDIDAGLVDILMAVVDWTDRCVEEIARDGTLSEALAGQSQALIALIRADAATDGPATDATPDAVPDWAAALLAAAGPPAPASDLVAIRYEPHPECFFNGDDPLALVAQVPDIRHLAVSPRTPWPERSAFDPFRCTLRIEVLSGAPRAEIEQIFRLLPDQVALAGLPARAKPPAASVGASGGASSQTGPEAGSAGETGRTAASVEALRSTVRIDTGRIDTLVAITSELVTAKNAILPLAAEIARETGNERLAQRILSNHQEIERLVGGLYSAVTRVRMIPLEASFRRFPRLVRETAARLGKAVDLVVAGEAVEADREIVEELYEPLLHLMRNALDHGIEPSADRIAKGKPARGTLRLTAQQHGDRIEVALADDGRGLDAARIRATAVARGMMSAGETEALGDAAVLQLVFRPGFSTAQSVSDLSGRGVGLDAVSATIRRLGGSVEMTSLPGRGTTFLMHLPITFAMSRLMVVEAAGERYGVPIEKVVEVLRVASADVVAIRAHRAFVLRDRTIPLVRLADLLQAEAAPPAATATDYRVIVVRIGGERIGIAVDAIAERAETLMRPLSGLLKDLRGIAGTTTLGDGKMLLVLELEELIR